MTDTPAIAEGRVARVVGPVVDVEFPPDRIPPLYNALTVEVNLAGQGEGESTFTMTLEVAQHLGDNLVRTIALKPTDGLVRGASVSDTGAPISVPVGDVTKGHVFNVTGDVLNLEEGETLDVKERWPIHRQPPAFDQLEARTKMFETGIKVIDLLTPLRAGRQDWPFRRRGRRQDSRPFMESDPARCPGPRRCLRVRRRRRAHP